MERVSNPLAYYRQHPEAQGLLSVSPELDLLDMATGGGKATFIGQMAKTFNKKALELAKDMSSKGATRDEIWTATGKLNAPTYKDVDGHWKQEIDDSYVKGAANPKVDVNNFDGTVYRGTTFGEALPHKGLEDAYDIGGMSVGFEPNLKAQGAYSPLGNNIQIRHSGTKYIPDNETLTKAQYVLERDGVSQDRINEILAGKRKGADLISDQDKSVLMHEMQHAVQEREGFAKGGSGSYLSAEDYDDVVAEFESKYSMLPVVKANKAKMTPHEYKMWALDLYGGMQPEGLQGLAFDRYKRLAGEAEARNVQTRLPMSMGERVAKAPWETLDVPERGLLVRGSTRPTKGLLGN